MWFKNTQPLQEPFKNFNDHFNELNLGHWYNEHGEECTTRAKGKYSDKTRRKGFGHSFQLVLPNLCVKTKPYFLF